MSWKDRAEKVDETPNSGWRARAEAESLPTSGGDSSFGGGMLDAALTTGKLVGGAALDVAGRVLDYPAGHARLLTAQLEGLANGRNVVTDDDIKNALVGKAPSMAELDRRQGYQESGSVDVPFYGPVSTRDAISTVKSLAVDPLSYIGVGQASGALKDAGKAAYKSGFKNVDRRLAEEGVQPLSEVLWQNGRITGSNASVEQQAKVLESRLNAINKDRLAMADELGARVDPGKALTGAQDYLSTALQRNPHTDATKVDALRDFLNRGVRPDAQAYAQAEARLARQNAERVSQGLTPLSMPSVPNEQITLTAATNRKTDLRNTLPDSAFDGGGYLSNMGQQTTKSAASGYQKAVEDAANRVRGGLGDEIGATNRQLQTLIEAQNPLALEARKGVRVNAATPVDAALAVTHGQAAAAKKVGDIAKTTWARTKGGKAMYELGESGYLMPLDVILSNPVARREFIRTQEAEPVVTPLRSAWEGI